MAKQEIMQSRVYSPETIKDLPFPGKAPIQISSDLKSQEIFYPEEFTPEPFPTQIVARNVISASLNTQSNRITGRYGFSSLGAIVIGPGSPSIKISPLGIVGVNSSGVTTFTLDGTTGSLSLLGALVAGVGSVIDGVYITDASIQTAKIADAAITNAKIANLAVNAAKIALATITSAQIHDLNADAIVAGTLSVGGTGQINSILIKKDASHGDNNLRWEGLSRIWEDTSNNLGIRATGAVYIYAGNYSEEVIITSGGQASFKHGISCDGGFNVINGNNARIAGTLYADGNVELVNDYITMGGHVLTLGRSVSVNDSISDILIISRESGTNKLVFSSGSYVWKITPE